MEGRGKGDSWGEWHVGIRRVGVEVKVSVVIVGVVGV